MRTSKPIIGLDIGSHAVKVVQLSMGKGKYKLEKFGMMPLSPQAIVDGMIMESAEVTAAIKELIKRKNIKTKNAAIAMAGPSVIVKTIHLPMMTDEALEMQIAVEAEQYVPFDLDEVVLDFQVLRNDLTGAEGESQMSVLLVAGKTDVLEARKAVALEAGLNPVVMDVDVFAIANMYEINYELPQDEVIALVNIGRAYLNINILVGGVSTFTRDVLIGGSRYIEALRQDLGVSDEDAEAVMHGTPVASTQPRAADMIIDAVNGEVTAEITRSFDFFRSATVHEEMEEIKRVVLSGGCATMTGLAEMLSQQLGIDTEFANPFRQIELADKDYSPEALAELAPVAAVGVGLAMRSVGDR